MFRYLKYSDTNKTFKDVSFTIRYRTGNKNNLKKKWSKILNIPKDRFQTQKRNNYKMLDSITFQINSIIFRKVLKRIIDLSLPIIKRHNLLRSGFLRGEFAADGKFGIEKDTNFYYISEVTFCYNIKKEIWLRDFIISCLKSEGIKQFNSIPGYIRITGWKNYLKFWNMRLFDRCLRKKNKFLKVIRQFNVHFKITLYFLNSIINSLNLTTTELTRLLNLHRTNLKKVKLGDQLLKMEQIYKIIQKSDLKWEDIITYTKGIRIGKLTYLKPERNFIEFLINEKNLN